MSRKHNAPHPDRGTSNYPDRLARRGLNRAPELPSLEDLRRIQTARAKRTGSPVPTAQSDAEEAA